MSELFDPIGGKVANNVKDELLNHGVEVKAHIQELMKLTYIMLDHTQKKKLGNTSFVFRNIQKVKAAIQHLGHLNFEGLKAEKTVQNNELIKIYSDTVKNLSKLEACLADMSSENRHLSSNEIVLKRNMDCLRLASGSLKHFDFDMGFSGKELNELEERRPYGQKSLIQK